MSYPSLIHATPVSAADRTTWAPLVVFTSLLALLTLSIFHSRASANEELRFEKDIRPIFRAYCFDCHGATEEKEGGLDLRQVRLMLQGGDSGEAIVPGQSAASLLVERIASGEMPPGDHPVPQKDLLKIRNWIDAGAKTARPEPVDLPRGLGITPEERAYWAFQPIQRPAIPAVEATDRVRTPIDAFLLARLEAKGLTLAPDAAKAKLIRRAYLDLIGLPPTPQQVTRFLEDDSAEAWEKVIEELLASRHYGERWGRHWLDVAGYADSEGADDQDLVRPWAYKYRDWVIEAFNRDMPFDQFITWQLAGDELIEPPLKNFSDTELEKLTATGFLRMAMDGTARGNNEENRNAVIRDTIDIVSSSFLGLSVKCAQCHDHRYDPISHEDYFRLRALFEPALDYRNWRVPSGRLVSLYTDEDHAKAAEIEKQAQAKLAERNQKQAEYMKLALEEVLAGIDESVRDPLRKAYQTPAKERSPEQLELLKKYPAVGAFSPGVLYQYNQKHADELKAMDAEIAQIRSQKPVHEYVRALTEPPGNEVAPTMLFHRGDYRQPKYEVQPGGLTVCAPEESPLRIVANNPDVPTTGRRLAYARWLTSGRHPLVARVLVNRFWLHHFGQTFVATPEEFGKLGSMPTHPELLDWLADEFMAKGWSLKELHRLILKSTVYQQASTRHAEGNARDQNNELYWHFPVHRLEAEVIRDMQLVLGHRLDLDKQFGPPVPIKEDETGQVIVDGDKQRRSIYLQVRRSQPVSILESFDAPVMQVNCSAREATTAATQSLMLMNSRFALDAARAFAARVNQEAATVNADSVSDPTIDEVAKSFQQVDPWSYGYGAVVANGPDAADQLQVKFTPYPRFLENMWKGSEQLPDPVIGWSFLNATSGHPDIEQRSTIRRWTSPVTGKIRITGSMTHHSEAGDGVELKIISSRQGQLFEKKIHHAKDDYQLEIDVQTGEIIDTLVGSGATNTSDSFTNVFRMELVEQEKVAQTWDSQQDFRGQAAGDDLQSPVSRQIVYAWQLAYGRPPSADEFRLAAEFLKQQLELLRQQQVKQPVEQAMINLCQTLISSNEFLYVD